MRDLRTYIAVFLKNDAIVYQCVPWLPRTMLTTVICLYKGYRTSFHYVKIISNIELRITNIEVEKKIKALCSHPSI